MLFIQHEFTEQFFCKIFKVALDIGGNKFVLWEDPCSCATTRSKTYEEINIYFIGKEMFEAVTLYHPDDTICKSAGCYAFTMDSVSTLIKEMYSISKTFDSMSIYNNDSKRWIVCMIFHENMMLVKNIDNISELLDDVGVKYSYSPPSWW